MQQGEALSVGSSAEPRVIDGDASEKIIGNDLHAVASEVKTAVMNFCELHSVEPNYFGFDSLRSMQDTFARYITPQAVHMMESKPLPEVREEIVKRVAALVSLLDSYRRIACIVYGESIAEVTAVRLDRSEGVLFNGANEKDISRLMKELNSQYIQGPLEEDTPLSPKEFLCAARTHLGAISSIHRNRLELNRVLGFGTTDRA